MTAVGIHRWGRRGRVGIAADGSFVGLPDFDHASLERCAEVLDYYPQGFLLHFERDVVGEIGIEAVGNDVLAGVDKRLQKFRITPIEAHGGEKHLVEPKRGVVPNQKADTHFRPFVVAVLPLHGEPPICLGDDSAGCRK